MPTSRLLWWGGIVAAASGAVLCVLGWYGVSGERFAERQIPYLASCTVPGAALIVAGAVLLAGVAWWRPGEERPEPPAEPPAGPEAATGSRPASDAAPVRVPGGTLAHRPDCPLVVGKADAVPVGDARLDPCPVCEPES
ncbi:hypothetical protein [Streptomyces sp. NPDC006368]|uniref:hypothetical protein n=1 Tax=Streptomyces sp. NPDC006368 TaxID=3156760 RepID=UPI0033B0927B